jgi:hypothetical protein
MPRVLKSSALALLLAVLLPAARRAAAQTNSAPNLLMLTAVISNNDVVLSWHLRPGNWGLVEQQPAFKADWKRIGPELYRTNSDTVSVKLPLPGQTALYRLQPFIVISPAAMPPLPPMPPSVTNRPGRPSFPASSQSTNSKGRDADKGP